MRRILWRDSAMTWPSLRVQLHLFPWAWRLVPRGYYDYSPGWHDPAEKDSRAGWWGPPFTFERAPADTSAQGEREWAPRPNCRCVGHSMPGVYHMRPCCDVPHVPDPHDHRDDATAIGDSTGWGGPVGGAS